MVTYKFKIGNKVKIVRSVKAWSGPSGIWVDIMSRTIGEYFTILEIGESGYMLNTKGSFGIRFNYWYPAKSFGPGIGTQLLFSFMEQG